MDLGLNNLHLSDKHPTHGTSAEGQQLPPPPPPPVHGYDYQPQPQQEYPAYDPHAPQLAPPGIVVEGQVWQDENVYEEDDESEDDRPLSIQPPHPGFYPSEYEKPLPPYANAELAPASPTSDRPVSFRNLATAKTDSTLRPAQFIKAHQLKQPQQNTQQQLPAEFLNVQHLYEHYNAKVYIEGYLFKKNESLKRGELESPWGRWYVELAGPVLTLWEADQDPLPDHDIMPQYINIADSTVDINEQGFLSLKTAGASRYLFEDPHQDPAMLDQWAKAIRLSCFEGTRIHKIYTKKFIMRNKNIPSEDGDEDDEGEDLLAKPMPKMEGLVQVRFDQQEWQKCWVVVSNKKDEKKLFGKKSVPSDGQLTFYESKKAKQPILTLTNVVQAYTVYPDSALLVDLATLLKVDGKLNTTDEPVSVMMMTTSTLELVKWLIGIFDACKLHGRPNQLIRDPTNSNALNFGETVPDPRLFLELTDLDSIQIREETTAESNVKFSQLMLLKVKPPQQPTQARPGMPSQGSGGMGPRTISMPQIAPQRPNSRQRTPSAEPPMGGRPPMMGGAHPPPPGRVSMFPGKSPLGQQHPQPMPRASAMPHAQTQAGKTIYASDDSDEDEDEDEDESESDDDSVFGTNHKSTMPKSVSQPVLATNRLEDEDDKRSSAESSIHLQQRGTPRPARQPPALKDSDGEDSESEDGVPGKAVKGNRVADDSDSESESDAESDRQTTYIPHRPKSRFPTSKNKAPSIYQQPAAESSLPSFDPSQFDAHQPLPPQSSQAEYQTAMCGTVMMDEDGPIIPQLGEDFANPHSLLGARQHNQEHQPSLREHEEYAKSTGQPLLHLPYKQPEPRSGLVGMISQLEHTKKDNHKSRMMGDHERMMMDQQQQYLMDQRQSMMPPMMPMMPMMDPRMSMMPPHMMNNNSNGRNQHASMMMPPMMDPRMSMMPPMPMMDPRMSMMPPHMMNNNNGRNQHGSMMMPPMMMDPRLSMMQQMQMMPMMYGMYNNNNGSNNSGQPFHGNGSTNDLREDDDEDDDVPLGGNRPGSAAPSPIPSTSRTRGKK
ncbi:hypothetical protein BCR43DRAFT_526832 [Syncephalastrum racemosum]|uniref:PH domain-containing protein n=1 Tax=Syncephalastrum racemosum TaxID=13706 RepID=A0A1X2H4A6_SYNRA|nr:hypothetical protein BCR43DRAFT_526832 [Syncephalastrum racemosum]